MHIAAQIQSAVLFTVMVNEITDCFNKEQVVLVFRWVDDELTAHEEFIGLYLTDSITAAALVGIIEDTLLHLNIKLENCYGQCYYDASTMSGAKGVQSHCHQGVTCYVSLCIAMAMP